MLVMRRPLLLVTVRVLIVAKPRRRPAPRATRANSSLTLPAVGLTGISCSGVGAARMAFAQHKSVLPSATERRRFQRVKVHLLGRYMLPDRREFPCQIINM